MAEKWLVIAVDGTSAMAPHWETIRLNYLEKIIRYFCRNGSTSQGAPGKYVLGLVIYGAIGPHNACAVKPSCYTKDMDTFLHWLSDLSFSGIRFDGSGIAEGLSNALAMFTATLHGNEVQQLGQRHCILVASSNPSPLPRPILHPNVQLSGSGALSHSRMGSRVGNAETVAGSFAQLFVSLSVIGPKQFPGLRAVFKAGNFDHQATKEDIKNSQHLILVSENFNEAHAALSQFNGRKRSFMAVESDLSAYYPKNSPDGDRTMIQPIFSEPFRSQPDILEADSAAAQKPFEDKKSYSGTDDDFTIFEDILRDVTINVDDINKPTSIWHLETANEDIDDGDISMMVPRKLSEPPMTEQRFSTEEIDNAAIEEEFDGRRSKKSMPAFEEYSFVSESSNKTAPEMPISVDFNSQENLTPRIVLSQGMHPAIVANVSANVFIRPSAESPYQVRKSATLGECNRGRLTENHAIDIPQKILSFTADLEAPKVVPHHAGHSNDSFVASSVSKFSGNVKISQPSGLQTTTRFRFSVHQTMDPENKLESSLNKSLGRQKTKTDSFAYSVSNLYERLTKFPHLEASHGYVNAQKLPRPCVANEYGSSSVGRDENSLKRKYFDAFDEFTLPSAIGSGIPMMVQSQHVQGENKFTAGSGIKIPLYQTGNNGVHGEVESSCGYVIAWEGGLSSNDGGRAVLVSRLVAYKKALASDIVTSNWPRTLHIDILVSQSHLNNSPYEGHVDYLVFEAADHSVIFDQMEKKRLCAYIRLPHQTLILSLSTKKLRLIGILYDGTLPLYKYQVYDPQQLIWE